MKRSITRRAAFVAIATVMLPLNVPTLAHAAPTFEGLGDLAGLTFLE